MMLVGLLANTICPLLRISYPISMASLFATTGIGIWFLAGLAYIRDKKYTKPKQIENRCCYQSPSMFLIFIPLLAVLAAYLVNAYHNTFLQIILILTIGLVFILITFDNYIPKYLYPLAIFVIALSLIYHNNLISSYLTGSDIHRQYFYAKLVERSAYWDYSLYSNVNTMASVTILPVTYSKIFQLDLTWVFKVIYPFFFALLPVSLYQTYKKFMNTKLSILACFFFVSFPVFWTLRSMTQYIGEFFLSLLILTSFDNKLDGKKKIIFTIVFGLSMILSHYGTSYLFLIVYMIGGYIVVFFLNMLSPGKTVDGYQESGQPIFLNKFVIIILLVFLFLWYTYIGGGHTLDTVLRIIKSGINGFSNFFSQNPFSQSSDLQMAAGGSASLSLWRKVHWSIFVISVVLMGLGFLKTLFKPKVNKFNFTNGYLALAGMSFFILFISVILPNFVIYYNATRMYHLTLIFISPFFIVGLVQILDTCEFIHGKIKGKLNLLINFNASNAKKAVTMYTAILCILLSYFLLNSGIVYEIVGDTPSDLSVSYNRCKNSNNPALVTGYYQWSWNISEIMGGKWLSANKGPDVVYADFLAGPHILTSYGAIPDSSIGLINNKTIVRENYFFIYGLNLRRGIVPYHNPAKPKQPLFLLYSYFEVPLFTKNNIYSNGDVSINHK